MKEFNFTPIVSEVVICGVKLTVDCRKVRAKLNEYGKEFGEMSRKLKAGEIAPSAVTTRYTTMLAELIGEKETKAVLKDSSATLTDMVDIMFYLLDVCKEAEEEHAQALIFDMNEATKAFSNDEKS